MADISATEIKRQASRLREEAEKYASACSDMIKEFNAAESAISGGNVLDMASKTGADSDLYHVMCSYDQSYMSMNTLAKKKLDQLADIMDNWANKTIGNEEAQSQTVQDITNKVSELNDVLGTLNK